MSNNYLSPETFYMMNKVYSEEKLNSEDFHKLLCEYPVLEKEYNLDGHMKNIHELFEEMTHDLKKIALKRSFDTDVDLQAEYCDCEKFYYELILVQLESATEENYRVLIEKYGTIFVQNVLANMEKYFNDTAKTAMKDASSRAEHDSVEVELKKKVNAIVRFRNGAVYNAIAEKLLREGGFVRGTREILPKELLKRRIMFADSLIGVYDAVESEEEYKQRAENEKIDIDEIINALYYNRFEGFLKNVAVENDYIGKAKVVRTAQILKISKIMTEVSDCDYFVKFLTVPDVNKLISECEKDVNEYLKECMKKAQFRIKKVIYPLTEAENGKYNDYILGKDCYESEEDIKNKITMLNEELNESRKKKSFFKIK